MKFIITGPMRSGTTYLASVLNSQKNIFCVEDTPWRRIPKKFNTQEEFLCFCRKTEARFMARGLKTPLELRSAGRHEELLDLYVSHLKQCFKCEHSGFKATMMSFEEMNMMIGLDYKIIITSRKSSEILQSWVSGIHPDLKNAAASLQAFYISQKRLLASMPATQVKVYDFETFTRDETDVIADLSDFLGVRLKKPQQMSHSFNRKKDSFKINSSLPNNTGPYLQSLPKKYSLTEILDAAEKVDNFSYKVPMQMRLKKLARQVIEFQAQ